MVKKTDYNTKITEIENKIPSIARLVNTTVLNKRATQIKNKLLYITNLATKAAQNTKETEVEGKIPDIPTVASKAALNNQPQRLKTKCLISQVLLLITEINKSTKIVFDSKMKEGVKILARKCQINILLIRQTKIGKKQKHLIRLI